MHKALIGIMLMLSGTVLADGLPAVPSDYPSHERVGSCNQHDLGERLHAYNETRLQLAEILRDMAMEPSASAAARSRLNSYAENLDNMRFNLPTPNPDSAAFRNFDFRLGMVLTSITLFLNTEDEHLAARFIHDRDDPNSPLGRYLVRLEHSRTTYMDKLAASQNAACG